MVNQLVSHLSSPVLLLGETGVGKDMMANSIHYSSPRRARRVLEETKGRIHWRGGAAELLEMNPSALRSKMNKLGISYGTSRPQRGEKKPSTTASLDNTNH